MRLLKQLYVQVLIAVAAAAALGLAAPSVAVAMKPFGDGFIALLKMLLGPIIFCTVVHGLASIQDLRKLGRLGTSLIYFEVFSTLGIVVGAVAGMCFIPAPACISIPRRAPAACPPRSPGSPSSASCWGSFR